jgi:hypothetical protein
MKERLVDNPITELYNSLFNIKEKMTSAEWVEVSQLLMKIHQMKTIIKWKTEKCNCCYESTNGTDSDTTDSSATDSDS